MLLLEIAQLTLNFLVQNLMEVVVEVLLEAVQRVLEVDGLLAAIIVIAVIPPGIFSLLAQLLLYRQKFNQCNFIA